MNAIGSGKERMRFPSMGHLAFAVTMLGFGIQGMFTRGFAPIWEPVPDGMPGRSMASLLCALVLLAGGIGLLWRRTTAAAARSLLAYLLLWLLLLRVPLMVASFTVDVWYSSCQTAVIVAAAWVLYTRFATDRDRQRFGFIADDRGVRIARVLYGVALIPFGLAHFLYLQATAPLVPHWLPAPVAWAYVTGAAFIAAGLAVLFGLYARLAATLSALQIGLFTLLVWVPVIMAGGATGRQEAEFVVSWALTAASLVVVESYRGLPWNAKGRR